ncbi:TIGR03862 family flavoprotein [Stella sp.]|uniref:TIGR03862 family flavoprotein n=1 Tax=Stella sp. TaxID=2912054 RepID=UPI0035B2B446
MTPLPRGTVAVVGGGPAGLMAAEAAAAAGAAVTVWEAMPSVGRKLLMAGRGGLNLTHSEPLDAFRARYGAAADRLAAALEAFPPAALRAWADALGQDTFVGSSGRVFPRAMKASPLLRAWLQRLGAAGVRFALRRRWQGWDASGRLVFAGPDAAVERVSAAATVLALGGASWPRLGSDGGWAPILAGAGVRVTPFQPANCGFAVDWSPSFRERFAGTPLKPVAMSLGGRTVRGEAMATAYGIEGGAVYALSAALRAAVAADGAAVVRLDLRPELAVEDLAARLAAVAGAPSTATRLRKGAGLSPLAAALLREGEAGLPRDPAALARRIKSLPLRLGAPQPLARAISSAGGVAFEAVDERFMLRARPGTFVAGEMLDWEAPTGGYLLQAAFATGLVAGRRAAAFARE